MNPLIQFVFRNLSIILISNLRMDTLHNKKIAFYTVFYGGDNNWTNIVPPLPSTVHTCFFFTNNRNTFDRANQEKWTGVYVTNVPIYDDDNKDAFSAKELKTCPHHCELLEPFDYLCYFDCKTQVDEKKVLHIIEQLDQSPQSVVFSKHPFDFHDVWDEYHLCLQFPKYAIEHERYKMYLEKYISRGFSQHIDTHYTTQFAIRKNNYKSKEIGELWYYHIAECGIECQISFSIVQQLYKKDIMTINYQECYCYV